MKALIESEGVTPARRDRLAGAYNRGYRGYALTYRVCTPAAHEAAPATWPRATGCRMPWPDDSAGDAGATHPSPMPTKHRI